MIFFLPEKWKGRTWKKNIKTNFDLGKVIKIITVEKIALYGEKL